MSKTENIPPSFTGNVATAAPSPDDEIRELAAKITQFDNDQVKQLQSYLDSLGIVWLGCTR
jgi:hypothetical protein